MFQCSMGLGLLDFQHSQSCILSFKKVHILLFQIHSIKMQLGTFILVFGRVDLKCRIFG